ncbi:ABC transporter ATP-binding protein [Desulforhopalus singaporensis]|uniref:Branched-chain amino acid transport system permease protein n=1 Tax=Desulforhopalus singaporensis TaxID=91360 RepID=A0A1H0VBT5_9BACT|nr:ABC transporter ATP-binding protein [Desulforhopalus singaporensis]SDP75804.1 branched-chain amino acid transport system permease protein [Desulforhopalus singaporensis]
MKKLLQVSNVTKQFGGLRAIGGYNGLSFDVDPGSFTGLIGPNGSGKSTIFNLLSGFLKPNSGSIVFDGNDITTAPPEAISERGLARTFQTPRTFSSLTVIDNVIVGADNPGERLRFSWTGKWRNQEAELKHEAVEIFGRVGLSHRVNDRVGDLSGGELRMLEVARQMIRKPKLILLDEPTAGVDPKLQQNLADLLIAIHRKGTTIIVVEHNLHFLLDLVDNLLVINRGELLAKGSPEEIRSNPEVVSAYLGGQDAAQSYKN